jgi:pSer/pThr/pTyr-binding forkhead associated (FHA) protein
MISSTHAVLLRLHSFADNRSYSIVIDTSLNGTYVNGVKLKCALLQPGDTVRFGKFRSSVGDIFTFTFHEADNAVDDSLPFEEVFSCNICHEVFSHPSEFWPCGHMFCLDCIEENIREVCPDCGEELEITSKIKTHFYLNFLIEKLNKKTNRNEKIENRFSKLKELKLKFSNLQNRNSLLNINTTWTTVEKIKFQKGIESHPIGENREYFCWMVGLTLDNVLKIFSELELSICLFNLNLIPNISSNYSNSRKILIRYMYGYFPLPLLH